MDGLTGMIPYKSESDFSEQISFFPTEPQVSFFEQKTEPLLCTIFDWNINQISNFKQLK